MKLDFSGKSSDLPRVPNYLGGRDRRNVTFWVLGGGFLLLIASNFTNFSKFARAILPGQSSRIDTRVPLPPYREPLPYEAVQLLPLDEESTVESALAKQGAENPPAADPAPLTKEQAAPNTGEVPPPIVADAPSQLPRGRKYFSAVNVPLLATIQNEAPFRQTETEVWYHLFDVVNKAPPEQLKKEATPIYDFATIYGQSNYYRGQAIAMTGVAKWYREIKSDPPDNAAGIPAYYEIGFQTNPREDNPIIVYVIKLPEELPRGKEDPTYPGRFNLKPGVPMAFEGIFFKNAAYTASDDFRLMPTLIAKTIRIQPTVAAEPPTNPMLYLAVLLGLGVLFFLMMYFLSAQRKKVQFVIPTPASPLTIPEVNANDLEPKEPWPVLPEEK